MTLLTELGRVPGYPTCKEALVGKKVVMTYDDLWTLKYSDSNALGETILAALPTDFKIGAFLGATARLRERQLKRNNQNRQFYELSLKYSDDIEDQQDEDQDKPPDQRRAEWAWDFETIDLLFTKDVDTGDPVANSANEPFELTTEYCIPVLTIERWQAAFDPSDIINFVNHRNKSTFWGADPGMVIIAGIRDRKDTAEVYQGFAYRKVTYTCKFRVPFLQDKVEGWKEILMNIGTRYKETSGATVYKSLLSSGHRDKVKLNTDGTKRDANQDPLFLKFNRYPEAEFDDLEINNTQI